MSHRPVCALLAALALAATASGQERPAAESKRGAYVVKHASARDLAAILGKHFKGDAEIQAGPEGTSNTLLVRSSPAVFDEVMKLIEMLDRKPETVAVEVIVIELPAGKGDRETVEEKELAGSLDEVVKNLDALRKKGQVANVKRIQVSAQEGQPASLSLGETKPYTVGTASGRPGPVSYRNLGTIVRVTPQVAANRSVTLELKVEDSRMNPSEGVAVSDDKDDIRAPQFSMTSLSTRVSVRPGKAVLVKDSTPTGKGAAGRILIVAGARLTEPAPGSR